MPCFDIRSMSVPSSPFQPYAACGDYSVVHYSKPHSLMLVAKNTFWTCVTWHTTEPTYPYLDALPDSVQQVGWTNPVIVWHFCTKLQRGSITIRDELEH